MWETLTSFFDYPVAYRALMASTMVGVMCGMLGCFIVLRNMALVGDALAHAILPGVVVAFVIFGYSAFGFFLGSVAAGLVAAVGITWIQHNSKTKNDAVIGIVFTAMFSIGIIGISWVSRNEGVHLDLKDFLFGNILGVSDQDLLLTTIVGIFVLVSVMLFYRYLFITTFQPVIAQTMGISVTLIHYFLMLLLSFAVVASLQTVGVILVVAMLITPASTALLVSNQLRWVIAWSAIFGLMAAVIGLLLAVILETTPGPAMALTATIIYLLVLIFIPKKGLLAKKILKRKFGDRILEEDMIKQSFKLQEDRRLLLSRLFSTLNVPARQASRGLRSLQHQGLISRQGQQLTLTDLGVEKARGLIRAHRLWETYLVDKMGLDEGQIHEEAERYEHLLTDEFLDEVDQQLGFPSTDPHGSPIPGRVDLLSSSLSSFSPGDWCKISKNQTGEKISSVLWQRGLLPNQTIQIISKGVEEIILQDKKGNEFRLPLAEAAQIHVKQEHPEENQSN